MLLRSFASPRFVVGNGAILLRPPSSSCSVLLLPLLFHRRRRQLLSVLGPSLSSVVVTQRRYVLRPLLLLLLLLYPLPVARSHLPPIFVIAPARRYGGAGSFRHWSRPCRRSKGAHGWRRGAKKGREWEIPQRFSSFNVMWCGVVLHTHSLPLAFNE